MRRVSLACAARYVSTMLLIWRLAKVVVKLMLLLALVLVAFIAWGNLWPRPSHAPALRCPADKYDPCRSLSGRVLYHTAFGPGHRAHVVLMSRSSITLPGITSIELPRMAEPPGLSIGDWISVIGRRAIGSHGEHDFHATAIETSKVEVRCATTFGTRACRWTSPAGRRG